MIDCNSCHFMTVKEKDQKEPHICRFLNRRIPHQAPRECPRTLGLTLHNLKTERPDREYDVYIGRPGPLGNSFSITKTQTREIVCQKYEKWFHEQLYNPQSRVSMKVAWLLSAYERYGRLRFFCWCVPNQCHGETIIKFLLTALEGSGKL